MQNRLLFIVLLSSIILGSSMLTRGHIWGDDFASYIMQAESILNGETDEFVEHNSFTIFESSTQIGPVAYPWGYPLALTPAYALKGNHPLALKLPGLFFYAGFVGCVYLLMKIRLTQTESLLITCLFAFNPLLLGSLDYIGSDIPFLFFSTLALLLILRSDKHSVLEYIVIGCAIACAFFIRTTGFLLLVSLFCWKGFHLWQKRAEPDSFKDSVSGAVTVGATFVFFWLIIAFLFPGGGESYFAQYQQFQTETALGYMSAYFQVFNLFFGQHVIWRIIYYVLIVFFLIGAWERRKEDLLFIIFFVLWMIVLITWPSWQGPRFIFPLLPIFLYFTFQGMKFVVGKLPASYLHSGRWILFGFWSLIAIIFLINASLNAYTNIQNDRLINGPYDAFSREVYQYIEEETPAESVIIFFKPRAMRLMTNRDAILSTDCEGIHKGDYLVLSRKVGENLQIPPEQIDSCDLPLDQVLKNNRFIVYEIQK